MARKNESTKSSSEGNDARRVLYIQAGVYYSLYSQFRHGGAICMIDNLTAAQN